MADYEKGLAVAPDESDLHCNLVNVYTTLHQCEAALRHADQCTPHTDLYYRNQAAAQRCLGNYVMAITRLNEAGIPLSTDPYLYWNRAEIYFDLGEYDLAWADYERVHQLWPRGLVPSTIFSAQAAIAYERGDFAQAKTLIAQGQGRTWVHWGAPYYYLGMIYLEEGETEAALAALTWAEQTLDEGPLLDATRATLQQQTP